MLIMENLIPILIAIIFFGYKQYRKSLKQQETVPPPVPVEKPEKEESDMLTLDDLIEGFFGKQTQDFTPPVYENQEAEKAPKNDWMEEMHKEEPDSIEYTDRRSSDTSKKRQFETIQNKVVKSNNTMDFDLRKAVIYDAIMNPPYL